MERRVKERLIGATILVVLVVLIVPEFLPGPHGSAQKPDPGASGTLRYVVEAENIEKRPPTPQGPASDGPPPAPEPEPAAASASAAEAPAAAVAQAPVTVPAPAPSTEAPPVPVAKPRPVASPLPPGRAATTASTTSSGWTVQLGSFASRANAEALSRQLQAEGFNVYLSPIGTGSAARYRVRLGPVADRAAAAAIMARLQAHQHAATLVPPAG